MQYFNNTYISRMENQRHESLTGKMHVTRKTLLNIFLSLGKLRRLKYLKIDTIHETQNVFQTNTKKEFIRFVTLIFNYFMLTQNVQMPNVKRKMLKKSLLLLYLAPVEYTTSLSSNIREVTISLLPLILTRKCPLHKHCLAPPGWRKRISLQIKF